MTGRAMAAETTTSEGEQLQPGAEQTSTLFSYDVAREGRLVTRLAGVYDGDQVRVVAEIYPVLAPETNEPQWRFYDFPNREKAYGFVDETLLALEYLGCTVTGTEARATHLPGAQPATAASPATAA